MELAKSVGEWTSRLGWEPSPGQGSTGIAEGQRVLPKAGRGQRDTDRASWGLATLPEAEAGRKRSRTPVGGGTLVCRTEMLQGVVGSLTNRCPQGSCDSTE